MNKPESCARDWEDALKGSAVVTMNARNCDITPSRFSFTQHWRRETRRL